MAKGTSSVVKAGVGLAALAAAAAGAYYFYGKNGAKHRKSLKGWAVKARGEVMEKVEGLREVSQKTYYKVVEDVLKKYKKLEKVAPAEVAILTRELKSHWAAIKADLAKEMKSLQPRKVGKSRR